VHAVVDDDNRALVLEPVVRRAGEQSHTALRSTSLNGRRAGNELLVRMATEEPSGKPPRREFRLAVPRWHQQHEAVDLTALDTLQLSRDLMVKPGGRYLGNVSLVNEIRLVLAPLPRSVV